MYLARKPLLMSAKCREPQPRTANWVINLSEKGEDHRSRPAFLLPVRRPRMPDTDRGQDNWVAALGHRVP